MSEDFYPFVDSGDPAPDNTHLTGEAPAVHGGDSRESTGGATYTTRISVYDDMLSTPRVIVVEQTDVRTYLEDVTNTVHRTMKEQGGHLSLMIIRELVENFIHAQFSEPVISILDDGDTIRFADQGPGINDKERAFEFGVTSADRMKKRYIRGTGAGLPMVQQYVEAAGGAISVEDNLGAGTVVTVSVNPTRVAEIEHAVSRGAAVRSGHREAGPPSEYEAQQPYGTPGMPGASAFPQQSAGPEAWTAAGQNPSGAGEGWPPYPPANAYPQQGGFPGQSYPWPQAGAWPGGPSYGQPVGYGQPGAYGQPDAYGQPGTYGQPGAYGQANPYGQPGAFGQQHYGNAVYPAAMGNVGNPGSSWTPENGAAGIGVPAPAAAPTAASAAPHVSERGELAMRHIAQNGKGGPTDLRRAFGCSDATWSRELDSLAGTGLIYKRGQKYELTEMGRSWSQSQLP